MNDSCSGERLLPSSALLEFELGSGPFEILYYLDLDWFSSGDFAGLASAGGACVKVWIVLA